MHHLYEHHGTELTSLRKLPVTELTSLRKLPVTEQQLRSSRPPASGVRGALDSLVQGSLVDLFAAYSVAVAPLPRQSWQRTPARPDMSVVIGFIGDGGQGRLTLSLPAKVLDLMPPGANGSLKRDWARELANQLIGRLKNRLLQFDVRLQVGISTLAESAKLQRQLDNVVGLRVYRGRTLRGEVIVTLDGMPDESQLIYVGQATPRVEGEAILF